MTRKVASLLLPDVIEILVGPLQDGPVHVGNETSVGLEQDGQALHFYESRKRNVDSPGC